MRHNPTPQRAQKPRLPLDQRGGQAHRITEKVFGFSLWLCGILWFCGVAVSADGLRDPFTFSPHEGAMNMSEMVLIGVLWDEAHPLAIVGDENVGIGDRVMNWQIVEIQPDRIIVQRGDRRETVALGNSLPSN